MRISGSNENHLKSESAVQFDLDELRFNSKSGAKKIISKNWHKYNYFTIYKDARPSKVSQSLQ